MNSEKLTDHEREWFDGSSYPRPALAAKALRIIDQQAARIAELEGAVSRVENTARALWDGGAKLLGGQLFADLGEHELKKETG